MKRYSAILLAMLSAVMFSCSAVAGSVIHAGVNQAHGETVRIQLKWKHQFQFAGYYAAIEQGYYAAEGLNVNLVEGGTDHNPVGQLLAGKVQYAVADAGVLLARAAGHPLVVLAAVFQHSAQVILCLDKSIHSPADLRHKRIMLQQGDLTVEVLAILKKFGINRSDFIPQPTSYRIQDLIDGKTDAFPAYSSNEPFFLNQRHIPYKEFAPHNYGIDFYGDVLITSEHEIEQHGERAAAFRRASLKGWIYALNHIDATVALILQKYNSQHKTASQLQFEAHAIRDLIFPDVVAVGTSSLKRWRYIGQTFADLGYPVGDINWDRFIYRDKPRMDMALWHYRYWILFTLMLGLLLILYLYNRQLRLGIGKRTAELETISSEYKDILDHMQDAYYRASMDGKITWVSLACERQLGYSRDELIGKPLNAIYYEQGDRDRFLQALQASGGNLQNYEVCLRHRDGSRLWSEVNAQFFYDEQDNIAGVEGNVRNITDRKRGERERRDLSDQLQQAQKMESIGVLTGGIAHDFNNLLVGVMGNVELALLDNRQDELREYLEQIFKSARHGADLVRQMLAYSGQGQLSMGVQNLNHLLRDVSELLSTVIGKQVRMEQSLMDDLPNIYGDKNQLTQLMMNLLTNASEAMQGKPGEICLRTGVCRLAEVDFAGMYLAGDCRAGEFVFIEVKDSGCGMDEETQSRIFDPFFTTKVTGSGLGLAALLGIVRSHHGTLSLQSAPGKGACFSVFLPVQAGKKAVVLPPLPMDEPAMSVQLHGAVLVVDDEEGVRDVARRLLEREGLQVMTACDGEEAVQIFRQHADEIAVVLMDLTMPVMDGEQAFHAIRAIRPDASVLLSSGFSESAAMQRLCGDGLAGFVRKPYRRQTLLNEIARLGFLSI